MTVKRRNRMKMKRITRQWCTSGRQAFTHSHTHSRTYPLTHTLTHSLTHILTHTHTHSLTHSLTHTHTQPHTHPLAHTNTLHLLSTFPLSLTPLLTHLFSYTLLSDCLQGLDASHMGWLQFTHGYAHCVGCT